MQIMQLWDLSVVLLELGMQIMQHGVWDCIISFTTKNGIVGENKLSFSLILIELSVPLLFPY